MLQQDFSEKLLDMENIEINNVKTDAKATIVSFKTVQRLKDSRSFIVFAQTHDFFGESVLRFAL
ncbi:MAG: hypothetical protein RR716_07760 [Christensenellaceae bacterium]